MSNLSLEIGYARDMVTGVIAYLGLFMAIACGTSEVKLKENAQVVRTPIVRVSSPDDIKDNLQKKAIRLTELYNKKDCKEFFNVFPSTFEEFDRLYGFDEERGGNILYSKYPEHFPFFFGCSDVSEREKLNKVILIGAGGRYNDGVPVDIFHDSAFNLIEANPGEAKRILDNLSDKKAASFWYFLFDRPHPSDKDNKRKVDSLRSVLGENSKQSKLLSEQYKQILADWKQH